MKKHPFTVYAGNAFAACLMLGSALGPQALATSVPRPLVEATPEPGTPNTYTLSFDGLSTLWLGVNAPANRLTINRPSPGDNYWYRLPYTVEVIGTLPAGIRVVQNTGGFDLARFEGVPTEVGTFTVQLRATMQDGLTTTTTAVTFAVEDPRQVGVTPFSDFSQPLSAGRNGCAAGIGFNAPFAYLQTLKLSGLVTVEAEGLPEGLEVTAADPYSQYSFYIQGKAEEGRYPYVLRFKWSSDGVPLGELSGTVEVGPAAEAGQYLLGVYLSTTQVGLETEYTPYLDLRNGYNGREDDFELVDTAGITFELSGLPEGLVFEDGKISGTPLNAGRFEVVAVAKDAAGTVLAQGSTHVEVRPEITAEEAAGTYDSLVDRNQLNGSSGGRLLLTLTRTGRITGTLFHNFQRYPFNSRSASFTGGSIRITPPRSGVVIDGTLQDYGESESYQEDGTRVPSFSFVALIGDRAAIQSQNGRDKAGYSGGVFGRRAVPRTAANPSPYASPNRVNLIFVRDPWALPDQPAGTGFLSYRVAPTGVVTGTYWGPDGSAPVSVATRISHTESGGHFPLYLVTQNDSGKGSLSATLFLNVNGDSAGQGSFYQPASDRGSFPEGISMVNYTGVIGSRYTPQPGNLNLLGLEEGIQNAELELEGAGLDEDLEVPVTVADNSTAIAAAPTPTVSAVNARLDKRTGIVSGSLRITDSEEGAQTVRFRAMVNPQSGGAVGHFTLRGASREIKAGSIQLVPNAD